LNLSEAEFWDQSNESTIGFLRHAEIKHGRVAMAGFVGYIVHENGIRFPWKAVGGMDMSAFDGLSAPDVWDALPDAAHKQIIVTIGFFEWWSEQSFVLEKEGQKHYMRGGKPGFFPSFKEFGVHPVPFKLYDPFGLNAKKSDDWKAKRLLAEVNNGRLAMIGLMGFISEAKIPGSVPFLTGMIKPYSGEVMNVCGWLCYQPPAVMVVNPEQEEASDSQRSRPVVASTADAAFTLDDLKDEATKLFNELIKEGGGIPLKLVQKAGGLTQSVWQEVTNTIEVVYSNYADPGVSSSCGGGSDCLRSPSEESCNNQEARCHEI